MKVNRLELLESLQFSRLGVSRNETLEQSNAFVFSEGEVITFNDEVMTCAPCVLDFTAAVIADEFLKLMQKIPDDEIEVLLKDDEVVLKGKRKSAGVTCFSEILLPYDAVPGPKKWHDLVDGAVVTLVQASRTCGKDASQELTTMVHVTPDRIEACDNWRLFRMDHDTGFPEECLLPSESVRLLDGLGIEKVSLNGGWAHFKNEKNQVISIRSSNEKYHEGLDALLEMEDSSQVSLPANMADIISRVIVMMSSDEEPNVRIKLKSGLLVIESRKASGWYRERKKVKYSGEEMEFDINPKFLVELLKRTRKVEVSPSHRMKIEVDGVQFVVALVKPE